MHALFFSKALAEKYRKDCKKMVKEIEGSLTCQGRRITIIASRFNTFISERLIEGALDALKRHGAAEEDISLIRVPGAFEIPAVLKRIIEKEETDAVICLGAVIRGGTPHFDYVAAEVSKGVAQVGLQAAMPVAFGVLTTDTVEQAIDRAGGKAGNKGFEAAMSAIEMMSLYEAMK